MLTAFEEYLAVYNKGRGFELIGHSQGSAMLEQLIKEQIDPNPALRKQLVGAEILGGQVIVPEGKTSGGTFENVPACQIVGQIGCVVGYSSFLKEPPNPSNFGRPGSLLGGGGLEGIENPQVLCVNPTILAQGHYSGPALAYYPTLNAFGGKFPGLLGPVVQAPKASTPWVATPAEYSAQCEARNGASWLQLNLNNEGDPRERILETLGPLWGTHLVDVNAALGNLVGLVRGPVTCLPAREPPMKARRGRQHGRGAPRLRTPPSGVRRAPRRPPWSAPVGSSRPDGRAVAPRWADAAPAVRIRSRGPRGVRGRTQAMTRLSEYLLPTEKEAPADAEAISHKLMVRAGLVRQMGAGHVELAAGRLARAPARGRDHPRGDGRDRRRRRC